MILPVMSLFSILLEPRKHCRFTPKPFVQRVRCDGHICLTTEYYTDKLWATVLYMKCIHKK